MPERTRVVVYKGKHVSGAVELGIRYWDGSVDFFLTEKTALKVGDEADKLVLKNPSFKQNKCACCKARPVIFDRSVPLCKIHHQKQEQIVKKRNKQCGFAPIPARSKENVEEIFD